MAENHCLECELEKIRRAEKRYGWVNHCLHNFVATLALVGSIAASVLAALGDHKLLTAFVAAIPAAVVAITQIFPFQTRALAHWRKEYRFNGLLSKLRFEGADVKTVSQEFREIEARAFEDWPLSELVPGKGRGAEPIGASPEKSQ